MKYLFQVLCKDFLTMLLFLHASIKCVVFSTKEALSNDSDRHCKIVQTLYH